MSAPTLSQAAFDILLSLAAGPRHGYAMVQEIQARRKDRPMQPGLLYTTIPKLMDAGLVEEVAAPPGTTDKRRRFYQLTVDGCAAVRAEAARQLTAARAAVRLAGALA